MTDIFSKEKRSWIMSRVWSQDTTLEIKVRSLVHRMGYRFRLHRKDLPGKPDLAFISRKKAIFVHGCFWHGHNCPRGGRIPKSNIQYWNDKIKRNIERDKQNYIALESLGWKILLIWECELKDPDQIKSKMESFLKN